MSDAVNYAEKIMADSGAQDYNAAFHGLKQKEEKRPCQPRSGVIKKPRAQRSKPGVRGIRRKTWAGIRLAIPTVGFITTCCTARRMPAQIR